MASFKSFLSEIGTKVKEVFAWISSPTGQAEIQATEGAATAVVTAFNPAAGVALAGIEATINLALKQVVGVESLAAAAEAQSGTGAQKLAAVVSAIAPQVSATLQALGVKTPAATQVQAVSTVVANSLVSILNAFPASTAPAAPAAS